MTTTPRKSDPFDARDTFDTGSGRAGIYRLSRLEDAGLTRIGGPAVFDPRAAGVGAAELRRLSGHRAGREEPGRLEGPIAGRGGNSLQAGPGAAARFYRRAGGRRSGGDAQRDAAVGRRSGADQPA